MIGAEQRALGGDRLVEQRVRVGLVGEREVRLHGRAEARVRWPERDYYTKAEIDERIELLHDIRREIIEQEREEERAFRRELLDTLERIFPPEMKLRKRGDHWIGPHGFIKKLRKYLS